MYPARCIIMNVFLLLLMSQSHLTQLTRTNKAAFISHAICPDPAQNVPILKAAGMARLLLPVESHHTAISRINIWINMQFT